MNLARWILQITLIATVGFFGYHYFAREELRSCVSVPLASLSGKTKELDFDQNKVNQFVASLNENFQQLATQGNKVLGAFQLAEATKETELANQIFDKGQYLYCKSVVEKVEKGE